MLEFATFMYGMLAMFVLFAVERNHREQRSVPPVVSLVGWGLCSMSATLAALLLGLTVMTVMSGGVDITNITAA